MDQQPTSIPPDLIPLKDAEMHVQTTRIAMNQETSRLGLKDADLVALRQIIERHAYARFVEGYISAVRRETVRDTTVD